MEEDGYKSDKPTE